MKYYQIKALTTLLILAPVMLSARESGWRKAVRCADKTAEKKYYASAADKYECTLAHQCRKDSIPADSINSIKVKLGNTYMKMGNSIKAETNYGDIVRSGKADAQTTFSYGRALQANGKYAEATEQFDKVKDNAAVKGKMAKGFSELSDKETHAEHKNSFGIQRLPFNTNAAEYAPAFYKKGLAYTSNRIARGVANHKTMWNKQAFSDIYILQEDGKGDLVINDRLSAPLNSKLNDGTVCFNAAYDEIFFTRNNKASKEKDHLLIYTSKFDGSEWGAPKTLNFEFAGANYTHPNLSPDGQTLYFSSDVQGSGYGGMDIYTTLRTGDTWSTPVNAGATINTAGNELFPFVAGDSTLYFTSDGWPGYGGLDVFHAKIEDGKWGKAHNMGMNFNSSKDDLSAIVDSKNRIGYFSSNRAGDDDIYSFYLPVKKEDSKKEPLYSMKLIDMNTNAPVAGARVEVADPRNPSEGTFYYTNDQGVFYYDKMIKPEDDVRIVKDKYKAQTVKGAAFGEKTSYGLSLEVEKSVAPAAVVSKDDFQPYTAILYYELNNSSLIANSKDTLAQVVAMMKDPKNVVYVSGYADQRGTDKYNDGLSLRRVKEVADYLESQGIESIRVRSAYFGSVKLSKGCQTDPKCVEETNRRNRRVEIKVGNQ